VSNILENPQYFCNFFLFKLICISWCAAAAAAFHLFIWLAKDLACSKLQLKKKIIKTFALRCVKSSTALLLLLNVSSIGTREVNVDDQNSESTSLSTHDTSSSFGRFTLSSVTVVRRYNMLAAPR